MKTTFETGATTHAVNDLILFTDNTKKLADLRDCIYKKHIHSQSKDVKRQIKSKMVNLFAEARNAYYIEFKNYNNNHIKEITHDEMNEFCELYANDFENWKKEQ